MKTLIIPKGNGKVRTVVCPDPELKRRLRALVPRLNLLAEQLDPHKVMHGFVEGRSPVTNARAHLARGYTVSFDLADCFDTVSNSHVFIAMTPEMAKQEYPHLMECFVDGVARQGLPTSPALANIALSPVDSEIWERFCRSGGRFGEPPCVYTRYADDLTFSFNNAATIKLLLLEIPAIVERHGFKINEAKTKVQCAKAGRRIITGIAVGDTDITIPREVRRRIRAGEHQDKAGLKRRNVRRLLFRSRAWRTNKPLRFRFYCQLKGLKEWALLKMPAKGAEQKTMNKAVAAVVHGVKSTVQKGQQMFGTFMRRFG